MAEEFDNIIALTDDNGVEVNFEFLDLIEYKDEEFAVLIPADDDAEDADMVVILKVEDGENEDESTFVGIEDDALVQEVFEIFKERAADEFQFVDDEE